MEIVRDHNLESDGGPGACPPPLLLAAPADDRLPPDEADGVLAHMARCPTCAAVLSGLRHETQAVLEESRMLIVPPEVVAAALALRPGQAAPAAARSPIEVHTAGAPVSRARRRALWLISARRSLAAAASLGVVVAGYQVGGSLTARTSMAATAEPIDTSFGLLDQFSFASSDGDDLFALAFPAGAAGDINTTQPQEATP